MQTVYYILLTFFLVLSLMMILLVLIQKGRGGGLSAAFGGAGGNSAFGNKTGDVLTWATSVVFGIFMLLCIFLNLIGNNLQAKANNPLREDTVAERTAAAATGNLGMTPPAADGSNIPPVMLTPPPTTAPAAAPTTAPAAGPTTAPAASMDPAPVAPSTAPATQPNS